MFSRKERLKSETKNKTSNMNFFINKEYVDGKKSNFMKNLKRVIIQTRRKSL